MSGCFSQNVSRETSGSSAWRHGALAQLGERGLCKPEVRGSIPLCSTKSNTAVDAGWRPFSLTSQGSNPARAECAGGAFWSEHRRCEEVADLRSKCASIPLCSTIQSSPVPFGVRVFSFSKTTRTSTRASTPTEGASSCVGRSASRSTGAGNRAAHARSLIGAGGPKAAPPINQLWRARARPRAEAAGRRGSRADRGSRGKPARARPRSCPRRTARSSAPPRGAAPTTPQGSRRP